MHAGPKKCKFTSCCERIWKVLVKAVFFMAVAALKHKPPPQIAKMYCMVPFPLNLSPREAVKEAALSICHSVSAELENSSVVIVP